MYSYLNDVWPTDKIEEHYDNNKENTCESVMHHITNCDECLKKVYIKCKKNNLLLTNKQITYIKLFLIGIILILILHLIFI